LPCKQKGITMSKKDKPLKKSEVFVGILVILGIIYLVTTEFEWVYKSINWETVQKYINK